MPLVSSRTFEVKSNAGPYPVGHPPFTMVDFVKLHPAPAGDDGAYHDRLIARLIEQGAIAELPESGVDTTKYIDMSKLRR